MLKQSQHSFGTVVRDVGIACAEDVAQMLAKLACSVIWLEDRHVFNVRDGMDGQLRLSSGPALLARNTFGQGHVLFCLVELQLPPRGRESRFTSRPSNSSSQARILSFLRLSIMLQTARKLRHSKPRWSKHLATSSHEMQHCLTVVVRPCLYARRAVQATSNLAQRVVGY